jgi:hypothetical protein
MLIPVLPLDGRFWFVVRSAALDAAGRKNIILRRRWHRGNRMARSKCNRTNFTCALVASLAALLFAQAGVAGMICASYEYHPNLVRSVQKALVADGARGIVADGRWGPKSREALREFQRRKGLVVNGEVDEPTFRALFGPDVPYEGVTVRRNPQNAPEDIYLRECPEDGP